MRVLRSDGSAANPGELGRIVCALPIAPGCFNTLYKADQRFQETYFSRFPVRKNREQYSSILFRRKVYYKHTKSVLIDSTGVKMLFKM